MQKLAKAYKPQELAHDAYPLYERFRLDIPAGTPQESMIRLAVHYRDQQ